jgi:hypothetical protein
MTKTRVRRRENLKSLSAGQLERTSGGWWGPSPWVVRHAMNWRGLQSSFIRAEIFETTD